MEPSEKYRRTQLDTLKNELIYDYCRSAIYLHNMNFLMLTARHRLLPLLRWISMYVNNQGKSGSNKYITCPHCGEQILMAPALSDMIQAIENHLSTHQEGHYPKHDPIQAPNDPCVSEDLAEQVLVRAAEIGDTLSNEPAIILHTADTAQ